MKAVISNRIYLNVDEELKKKLMAELTYKIPKKYVKGSKMKQYEIIRTYKNISPIIMSIPAGRLDLVPEHYVEKCNMHPIDYLKSLIEGQKVSSIPIQLSELEFLMQLLLIQENTK